KARRVPARAVCHGRTHRQDRRRVGPRRQRRRARPRAAPPRDVPRSGSSPRGEPPPGGSRRAGQATWRCSGLAPPSLSSRRRNAATTAGAFPRVGSLPYAHICCIRSSDYLPHKRSTTAATSRFPGCARETNFDATGGSPSGKSASLLGVGSVPYLLRLSGGPIVLAIALAIAGPPCDNEGADATTATIHGSRR